MLRLSILPPISTSHPTPSPPSASIALPVNCDDAREVIGLMARKRRKVPKEGPVWRQSGLEVTRQQRPHYNGFACGHGPHGDAKYNRTKANRQLTRELDSSSLSSCRAFRGGCKMLKMTQGKSQSADSLSRLGGIQLKGLQRRRQFVHSMPVYLILPAQAALENGI